MFVEKSKLKELEKAYGSRFVDGLICRGDGWEPLRGLWIQDDRYAAAIAAPRETARNAHSKWSHTTRKIVVPIIPHRPTVPRITPADSWLLKGPKMWAELENRARNYKGDFKSEQDYLAAFDNRIGCGDCRSHWMEARKKKPLNLSSADDYFTSVVDAHNEVNIRLGKAVWLPPAPGSLPLVFHLGATGLGDAIGGLYAACGLADSTKLKVIYYAHSANWLQRVNHPGVEIRARTQNIREMGVDGCYDDDYHRQIATGISRVRCYAEKLAERLKVKSFDGVRPKSIDTTTPAEAEKGYILLAPFCCYSSRDWDKFGQLASALEAQGHAVIAMGSGDQGTRLKSVFLHTHAKFYWGLPPDEAIRLLLRAKLFIGNDSGIAHLAGLLGVPALSIHAGCLPHEFLFDYAPTVSSVLPGKLLPRSDHNPQALRKITVEKVMQSVQKKLSHN